MPPKTVTCRICGEDILKSRTYATGEIGDDGLPLRACKEHEGVSEKAEELRKEQTKEAKKSAEKLKWRPPSREELERREIEQLQEQQKEAQWGWDHCWCCEQPGIHLKDFSQVQLIAMEKARLLGVNPFSNEMGELIKGILKQAGVTRVMHRFEMDEEMKSKFQEWKNRIHWKLRPVADMTGIIQLCFDCQRRTGIVFDLNMNMPKADLTTLAAIGSSYDGSDEQRQAKLLAVLSLAKDEE